MGMQISNNSNMYDYMNSFFGNSGSNNSSTGSIGGASLLSDYYSVKSGSYLKLAKKYYASDAGKKSTEKTSAEDEKVTKLTQSSAESAVKSLKNLMDKSLYEKTSKTAEDGSKTYDYDKKAILDKLKAFVSDYNGVIENTGEMEDGSTLKNAVRMVNETKVYAGALSKIGVTIGKDNKLTIDEDAFNQADMLDAKNLFTGGTSFASNTQMEMLQIYNSATSALNSSGSTYTAAGVTGLSTGSMFDSLY